MAEAGTNSEVLTAIKDLNHPAPDVLDRVSLDIKVPLEGVHISLGEQVDEILRRRGLDLANRITEGRYNRLVFLDLSARPVQGLVRAAHDEALGLMGEPLPQILSLNIGKEKVIRDRHDLPLPGTLDDFVDQWPKETIEQFMQVLDKAHMSDGARVLIVDELRGFGTSMEYASASLRLVRPDLVIEKFWLINSRSDKDILKSIYERDVPWKKIVREPVYSLVADDIRGDGLSTFVSKPKVEPRSQEYRRRLSHYFKGLYDPEFYAGEIDQHWEQAVYPMDFLREMRGTIPVTERQLKLAFLLVRNRVDAKVSGVGKIGPDDLGEISSLIAPALVNKGNPGKSYDWAKEFTGKFGTWFLSGQTREGQ